MTVGDTWESLGLWTAIVVGGFALLLFAWVTIYNWFENRADRYVDKWFRDAGCAETTGEITIVRSHKKGGSSWLLGFWSIMHRFKGKVPAWGSRPSSSDSPAAISNARHGRVIPPTRSTPASIEPSISSSK